MKSLDQKAGMERERPELKIYKDVINYHPYKVKTYVTESWRAEAKDIKDSDWVPSIVAAHLAGVSKQAIHDRIKRETLKSREVHRSSWYGGSGQKVVLVRLGDAKKKKKAGRPKACPQQKQLFDEHAAQRLPISHRSDDRYIQRVSFPGQTPGALLKIFSTTAKLQTGHRQRQPSQRPNWEEVHSL